MRSMGLLMLLGLSTQAMAGKLGLGVMLGEPTGLNGKVWLDKIHAVDFGLAYSLSEDEDLHLHADYLFHNNTALAGSGMPGRLALYYGIGARLSMRDDNNHNNGNDPDHDKDHFGVRIPLGIAWTLPSAPLDFFLELAPVVDLMPDTGADLEGGLGLRFWFK